MGHHHHHRHSDNIRLAFFLNLGFTVFEFIGGIYVNSVAIISDALHDLGDSLSLGMSWFLDHKSRQHADSTFTFGYRRFSLLGALINSVVLIVGAVFVISYAVDRIIAPEPTNALGMFVFAIIGVAVNGYAAWRVSHGDTLNEKVVSWHLLEDVLSWVAVLIASVVLIFKDIYYLDPALSLFITAYVLWNVVRRLRETLHLFLQGRPAEIDVQKIEQQLTGLNDVIHVDHLHVWSLDGENHVFTAHVMIGESAGFSDILRVKKQIRECLKPYRFSHSTVEVELNKETSSRIDYEMQDV
jgi:cobalt-zinc-cadmium efflux system protein